MSKMGSLMIDEMNRKKEEFIVLQPGETWSPLSHTEKKEEVPAEPKKRLKPEDCRIHEWADVLLFRTTVTECKKCGKLRE